MHNPRDLGYEFSTWTLKAIAAHMYAKFNKVMTLGGVPTMLKRNNIRLVVPRPISVRGDPVKKSI
ncbi:MAG: helix-turn-helix domain-containing protein [Promethearchaeota archaeon]